MGEHRSKYCSDEKVVKPVDFLIGKTGSNRRVLETTFLGRNKVDLLLHRDDQFQDERLNHPMKTRFQGKLGRYTDLLHQRL